MPQKTISDESERLLEKASNFFDRAFSVPSIIVVPFLSTAAGRYTPAVDECVFSEEFYSKNKSWFLRHVVPHEIAHVIAYQMTATTLHDETWRKIMRECFRRPAIVYHPLIL